MLRWAFHTLTLPLGRHSHSAAPSRTSLTLWTFKTDVWLTSLSLCVVWWSADLLQAGLPHDDHDLHDWHVLPAGHACGTGMEHVSPGCSCRKRQRYWDQWKPSAGRHLESGLRLAQFTSAARSRMATTPSRPTASGNTLGSSAIFMKLLQRPTDVASTQHWTLFILIGPIITDIRQTNWCIFKNTM